MSQIYKYTVISSQMTTASTLAIVLHNTKQRRSISYEPGQYVAISFAVNGRPTPTRCFSVTSSPTDQGYLQFGLRVHGEFTKTAAAVLIPGAEVIVEGPFGNFVFNAERDKTALMIAGGIGVTPFISMLRYAAQLRLPNRILLLYSCKNQNDIPFLDELLLFEKANPQLSILFVLGSGPNDRLYGQNVAQGHIDGALLDKVLPRDTTVECTNFICGPAGFMAAISKTLRARGVAPQTILTESFSQGQTGPKTLRHNLPLQVYTLTGLSLLLGSTTILIRNTASVSPSSTLGTPSQNQITTGTSNSRQNAVSQTITTLKSGGKKPVQTHTSTSNAGASTGSTSTKSSTTTKTPTVSSPPSSGTTTSPPKSSPGAPAVAVSLNFSASSTNITSGESTTLSWSTNTNATAPVTCTASGGWSGSVGTSGSQSVSPNSTTTYSLSCANSVGSSGTKSVTIKVAPACVSTPSSPC